jgi:hypothetical protein
MTKCVWESRSDSHGPETVAQRAAGRGGGGVQGERQGVEEQEEEEEEMDQVPVTV